MRTKQEKARELAAKYAGVPALSAVQLIHPGSAALAPAAAALGFTLVGAGMPVALGVLAGLVLLLMLATRAEYATTLAELEGGSVVLVQRSLLTGRSQTSQLVGADLELVDAPTLGYLTLRVLERRYRVRPVFARDLRDLLARHA